MALTLRNIRKWYRMLIGTSIQHVHQGLGTLLDPQELLGYYNDLTEKVIKAPELLSTEELPRYGGTEVYFPVDIFQYGLGAYDLYLQTKEQKYLTKVLLCAEWALANQLPSGAWDNFSFLYPEAPYGAMAQGEGASLLLRVFKETQQERFLIAAHSAIDFMLLPLEDGGTTRYDHRGVIFMEYTHRPVVMNGWIFAWWGLYDYVLVSQDNGRYQEILYLSCQTLEKELHHFARSFWSMYDEGGRIASPFYHRLHIAQMQAMYQLTQHTVFSDYAQRWTDNDKNLIFKMSAFCIKAWQKIIEKEHHEPTKEKNR